MAPWNPWSPNRAGQGTNTENLSSRHHTFTAVDLSVGNSSSMTEEDPTEANIAFWMSPSWTFIDSPQAVYRRGLQMRATMTMVATTVTGIISLTDSDRECSICYETSLPGQDIVLFPCEHDRFCKSCITSWFAERFRRTCPLCRSHVGFTQPDITTRTTSSTGTDLVENRSSLAAPRNDIQALESTNLGHNRQLLPGCNHHSATRASPSSNTTPLSDSGDGSKSDVTSERSFMHYPSDEDHYDELLADLLERDVEEAWHDYDRY
jgi:hypothetical protein